MTRTMIPVDADGRPTGEKNEVPLRLDVIPLSHGCVRLEFNLPVRSLDLTFAQACELTKEIREKCARGRE